MFYIMSSLSTNSALNKMRGGETMKIVLIFGSVIVGIFCSFVFILYKQFSCETQKKKSLFFITF